jgi:hypothetical protein
MMTQEEPVANIDAYAGQRPCYDCCDAAKDF